MTARIYTAKVVGTDPKTDLALIKVDGKKDFAYVKFADHEPRIGDWVVAVGNPFGLGGTVTAGIVSAEAATSAPVRTTITSRSTLRSTKAIPAARPSTSDGNVIGVNTAIFSPSGGSVGIGFDIPAETVKMVVAQLKDNGYVTRGWMGVQIQTVTADIADSLGMKQGRGRHRGRAASRESAAKAGIEAGDVITAINGTAVKDSRDLARKIGMMAPGSSVKLDVLRKGEAKTVTLTLGQMPNEQQAKADNEQAKPATVAASRPELGPAEDVAGSGRQGRRGDRRRSGRPCGRSRPPDRRHHPRYRRQGGRQRGRCSQGADPGEGARQARYPDAGEDRRCGTRLSRCRSATVERRRERPPVVPRSPWHVGVLRSIAPRGTGF